jgi:phospholipid/cholesterol/gamma-HCH transport system permease protein
MGLGLALIKETGPLVTALLFSGRVGAGIGAELGAMRVTEQIDALESLAVDSFKHLVVTRMVACMVALPLLTTVMNFTGIIGGYVAEKVISGISFNLYFTRALSAIDFEDYIPATAKTILFGFMIATISSYLGYFSRGGSEQRRYHPIRSRYEDFWKRESARRRLLRRPARAGLLHSWPQRSW